ncbi:MAG: hypothetical protein ACRD2Z_05895 [Thermoanaerobaculia bacterium]
MRTLYLHVGGPKAASSTIQHYIYANEQTLRRLGYTLVDCADGKATWPGHAVWYFQNLIERPQPEAVEALMRELGDLAAPRVVVTAENLYEPRMASLFEGLAAHWRMRVLLLVRRQDDWIYVAWKQWYSKAGYGLSSFIEVALRDHLPNYPASFDAWTAVAGADNVRLLSLDFLEGTNLFDEIQEWLEVDRSAELVEASDTHVNASFDYRLLDLLSRHRGAHEDAHDSRIELFLKRYSHLAQHESFRLPDVESARILQHFRTDNERLLGPDRTATLHSERRSNRRIVSGFDTTTEHDFALACTLEALGRMSEELDRALQRIEHLENKLR